MRPVLLTCGLVVAGGISVFGQVHSPARGDSRMVMSTSEVIDLGRKVGRDQGINVDDRKHVTLNLLVTKDGTPILSGYITLGIYRDLDLLGEVSINEKTGQLVDSENCAVYEYPDVLYLQAEYTRSSGAKPLTIAELSGEVGCNSLKELKVPATVTEKKR
jgi:hypothetical protein